MKAGCHISIEEEYNVKTLVPWKCSKKQNCEILRTLKEGMYIIFIKL